MSERYSNNEFYMRTNRSGSILSNDQVKKLFSFSYNTMIELINKEYKEADDKSLISIMNTIFSNQLKNLTLLIKEKNYYTEKQYFRLRNFFIANARNVKIIRENYIKKNLNNCNDGLS